MAARLVFKRTSDGFDVEQAGVRIGRIYYGSAPLREGGVSWNHGWVLEIPNHHEMYGYQAEARAVAKRLLEEHP
jgi:hypothetical protein